MRCSGRPSSISSPSWCSGFTSPIPSAPASSSRASSMRTVIFAALVGAIVWNLITWALGIPSSSSHALIGGLVGARHGEGRAFGGGLERTVQDAAGDRAVAAGRLPAGAGAGRDRVLAVGALDAVCGRPRLPHPAIRLGLAVFARPWRQRRAEDHGHHRGAAVFAGPSRRAFLRSRSGWCWPARPRWRWAR